MLIRAYNKGFCKMLFQFVLSNYKILIILIDCVIAKQDCEGEEYSHAGNPTRG